MGGYLNTINNAKANASINSQPNENFARELLQLFSVGVYLLNRDGTLKTDVQGNLIPTYGNQEVTQFAKVFTGWTYQPRPGQVFNDFQWQWNYTAPMAVWAPEHDTTAKTLLNGVTLPTLAPGIPTNTNNAPLINYAKGEVNAALDNIFVHPNIAPFVVTRLIQHMVTANPTPAYVQRVVTVFENNGQGVRGDMKAVLKAILLDDEARNADVPSTISGYGHLRSGILFITALLRQFNAQGDLGGVEMCARTLSQDVFSPPSVFSYYKPGTTITTGTAPNTVYYLAPETQTLVTENVINRINFVNTLLFGSISSGSSKYSGVTSLDTADFDAVALNTSALINLVDERFLHSTMSSAMRTEVANAVNSLTATTANRALRARTALYLVACSTEYQIQR